MSSVNESLILIMGGSKSSSSWQSDILLFDTNVKTVTTEVINLDYKFAAY